MAKFIFVRHGQSKANAAGMLGTSDSPLSKLGLEQAREAGHKLKKFDIKTIVCSPFLRAQQTAETIASELGIDLNHIIIIDELHERRLGKLEGTPKIHSSKWYDTAAGTGDMERRATVIKRMQKCLDKIQKLSKSGLVLAVGHSCAGFYLIEVAKGKSRFEEFNYKDEIINAQPIEVEIAS